MRPEGTVRPEAESHSVPAHETIPFAALLVIGAVLLRLRLQTIRGADKTDSGVGCGVYPGTTTITWRPRDRYHLILLSWAKEELDENGELVSVTPVGTPIQVRVKDEKSPYTTATPEGANLWSTQVFGKKGDLIGVGGGVCD